MNNVIDIAKACENFTKETVVFVAYEAGRKAKARGISETQVAVEAGINLQHYVGRFVEVRANKWGEPVLTLFCFDRGTDGKGSFRAFNANLGKLRQLEVVK